MKKRTFKTEVIKLAEEIPFGKVTTYGILARAAGGHPMNARNITHILSRSNKEIPFHRIVYSDGKIWISKDNEQERKKLYQKEGITITNKNKVANLIDHLHTFGLDI